MRGSLIVVLAAGLAACGQKDTARPRPRLASQAPTIADATVLLREGVAPSPVLVIVAPDGSISVADAPDAPTAAERWARLDQPPPRASVAVDRQALPYLLGEARARNARIEPIAATLAGGAPPSGVAVSAATDDDPPPPEAEPEGDAADASGGIGAMVTRDEDDPQLARARAIQAAREAGLVGASGDRASVGAPSASTSDHAYPALPVRAVSVVGLASDGSSHPARALVIAAPSAKAAPVIDLLAAIDRPVLGVAREGRLRALRIEFGVLGDASTIPAGGKPWIEVRVGASEIVVEAVPSPAVSVPVTAAGTVDAAALGKAYAELRATSVSAERRDVDVLVGPDTDVQRLVEVIAALDGAGALIVSLGHTPSAQELARRGKRVPRVLAGQPRASGDLPTQIIRDHVKAELPKILACYERALATAPSLTGTVQTQFFISPTGDVVGASASGVAPEVATCVAAILEAIEFPRPGGGGGVQVSYPFTFRT